MLKKTLIGVLIVALLSTILIAGINFNMTKAMDYSSSGTPVGGIIWENTTWTLENSPYIITDVVQIPENVTLEIEPGVIVNSSTSKPMFLVHGKIYAYGTINNKIVFDGGGRFFDVDGSGPEAFVGLEYCIIKNGGCLWWGGYGSLSLKHSEVIDVGGCSYVWYPKRDVHIEYNIFINSAGFSVGHSEASVYIRYNLFKGNFLIENWASYAGGTVVKYNSFIDMYRTVLRLKPGCSSAAMSATENYWGTLNTSVIDSMIYDKNDDIRCAGFIEYLPILTEPHPDTPKISSTIYVDDDNTAGPWDGTVEHPYQNITQALKHALENENIFVYNGTYYENVVVNKTLRLIGENRENAIIDARGIGDALRIERADNVTVSNFTIRHGDNGIYLSRSHGSTIRNNNVTTNHYRGILGMYSTGNNFEENIVNNHWQAGIDLAEGSIDNIIQDNIMTDNGVGIYLRYNGNNTVQGNKVQSNSRGINVGFSNNNTIIGNIITSSGDYGILFEYCSGNDVCGNLIANNPAGIKLVGGNDNKIYHNNFIDNTDQVRISISFNIWDDGYPSGGNFWSNYIGGDLYGGPDQDLFGDDGIGDAPYEIDAYNQDRYPLMGTFTKFDAGIWNGIAYSIDVISNSTVSNFELNMTQEIMNFDAAGPDFTTGFCRVTVPTIIVETMWEGNYTVLVDGRRVETRNWTDAENTYIYFIYEHSEHKVTILQTYTTTLQIETTSGGTTDPPQGTHTYVNGTVVLVTALPDVGYSFDYWLLDGEVGTENPISILMDANHTLEAFFVDDIPPEISDPVQNPPDDVEPYQNVTVTVNVTDLGTGVYNVTLWYSVDNGTSWTPLNMTEISRNTYQATIPRYDEGTWVSYKIVAYDNAGNQAVKDDNGYYYVYHVIPEFPSTLTLLMLMLTTLIARVLQKKKRKLKFQ